jgi:hypothetical protein
MRPFRLTELLMLVCILLPSIAHSQVSFSGSPRDGDKSIFLIGIATHNTSVFLMPPGTPSCDSAHVSMATPLMLVTSPTVNAASITLTAPPAPASAPPFLLTLVQPLSSGTLICVEDSGTAAVPAAAFSSLMTVLPAIPTAPTFSGSPRDGDRSIFLNGVAGHNLAVFLMAPATPSCDSAHASTAAPLMIVTSPTTNAGSVTLTPPPAPASAPPFLLTLTKTLSAGALICAEDLGTPLAPAASFSPLMTVLGAPPQTTPLILDKLVAGATSLKVHGKNPDTVSIYQFDPGYNPGDSCPGDMSKATELMMVTTASGSAAQTSTSFSIPAPAAGGGGAPAATTTDIIIPLNQPLVVGTMICLSETATGNGPVWTTPTLVTDPNDLGRFRTYFTIGIQASNQLSTNSTSSTAGQYLEAGFINNFLQADGGKPGLSTNIDARLSPIPVAAPQTVVTTPATGTASTSVSPNVLSSQQALRLVTSVSLPWKTTSWNNKSDSFTFGPVMRGGFGTLLNPSTTGATAASNSSTASIVTSTSYSSAYYFWGIGTRMAWDRYVVGKNKTEEAPQTVTQFLVTFGEYSNLPSYVCAASSTPAPTTVITACNQGKYTPMAATATTPASYFNYARTLRPRLDIEGFAKIPGYPFILGIDANLQQYGLAGRNNLDFLNKPGNDIRIFVGVSINIATLFTKLGATGF